MSTQAPAPRRHLETIPRFFFSDCERCGGTRSIRRVHSAACRRERGSQLIKATFYIDCPEHDRAELIAGGHHMVTWSP